MASVVSVAKDFGCYFAKISDDFDPATDEVIVVKRDAARVWVEGATHARYIHDGKPRWCDPDWGGSKDLKSIGNMLECIRYGDLVEFVAMKTHRPPVEHEAKLPEPEDIDEPFKSAVLAVYPDAKVKRSANANTWYISTAYIQISAHEPAQFMAWKSAATRLRDAKPEATALPEPVTELSDKDRVKAVYPNADYGDCTHCIRENINLSGSDYLSDSFANPDEAWADAARKLEQTTEPKHDLPPGCSTEIVSAPVPSAGQGVA